MNLTPKETAEKLLLDFSGLVYPYIGSSMLTNMADKYITLSNAKTCAFLVVKNILNELTHHPSEMLSIRIGYWQQVEQEINDAKEVIYEQRASKQ